MPDSINQFDFLTMSIYVDGDYSLDGIGNTKSDSYSWVFYPDAVNNAEIFLAGC